MISYEKVSDTDQLPDWASRHDLVEFFHTTMRPYEDARGDIDSALDYAFSAESRAGGFLMLAEYEGRLAGALLMLNTGMSGYIPEHVLLFVTIDPDLRGRGIGGELIRRSVEECPGSIKLHVDFDNPAKRLYERLGFKHCYEEMRLSR